MGRVSSLDSDSGDMNPVEISRSLEVKCINLLELIKLKSPSRESLSNEVKDSKVGFICNGGL